MKEYRTITWVTASGQMGADLLEKFDQDFEVIHHVDGVTGPKDTEEFLAKALERDLNIILFVRATEQLATSQIRSSYQHLHWVFLQESKFIHQFCLIT